MLNWDLAYDYAAIYLLLIIIIWYFHEKRIPLASHRTFLVALAAVFVSTGLEIVSTKLAQMSGTEGNAGFWVTSTLQHLALNAIHCCLHTTCCRSYISMQSRCCMPNGCWHCVAWLMWLHW